MTILEVVSPAKINLCLYITGKRSDGYHELVSLMAPIGLADTITLELNTCRAVQVECQYPGVPADDTNLASRAASLFLEEYGKTMGNCSVKGMNIHIHKQIPVGGGLGGGSSNAASVLLALNRYFSSVFSLDQLGKMGMALGADVPFFLYEGAAIVGGVGEKVTRVSFSLSDSHLLLCHPLVAASTARVFEKYDFYLTQGGKYYTIADPILLVDSLAGPAPLDISTGTGFHNDLEDAAFCLYPDVKKISNGMAKILEKKVCMSGSGSCLFVLYPTQEDAQRACEKLRENFPGKKARFFVTSFYHAEPGNRQ